MFVKTFVFACLVGCVLSLRRGDLEKYGPFRLLLNSPIIKCVHDRSLNLDVSEITVYLYDFKNEVNASFPIGRAARDILAMDHLDLNRQFVMFVGGFTSAIHKDIEEQMRQAYSTQPDTYFLIPDHSRYTYSEGSSIGSYERSVSHVHFIGKAIGEMFAELRRGGVSAGNVHCVGHSLGGQILGHAGAAFLAATGERLGRITALDPAGPCFATSGVEEQVRAGAADHVAVYHCDSGALGSHSLLGDADFLVNGGAAQPTCRTPYVPRVWDSSRAASCSHRYCIDVWTASVRRPRLLRAARCGDDNCARDGAGAGAHVSGTERGLYYLPTAEHDLTQLR